MRLAIVTHNVIRGDGQGRINYEVAFHALRRGDQVSLIADRVDNDLLDAGAQWIPIVPGKLRRVNLFKVWEFAAQANRYLSAHRADFDLIHGNGFCLSVPHHVNTAHFVHSAWQQNPLHPAKQGGGGANAAYQKAYSALNARWERTAFAQAKCVNAVSHGVEQELRQYRLVPAEQAIPVIPNGVDISEFHPGPALLRSSLGLPETAEGMPLALFAGDLRTPRKNLDTVLKGLVHAPGVHLAVVGKAERSIYPEMAKSLGLENRVHFLGFRHDMADLMRAVDVFVFPSRYEPFGMVVPEAMASGVPIITCRETGASVYVTPEVGVILQNSEDADALATALREITGSSPERREAMGKAAWAAAQTLRWENVTRAYFDLYETCAGAL